LGRKNARKKRKCASKSAYTNFDDALKALNFHVRKFHPKRRVSAYRCKVCKKIHIGHNGPIR
jgi:hypothetical protein